MSKSSTDDHEKPSNTGQTITYNDVATKLLKDKLLLTALELHTELLESGRELKQLKDFFSNPGNFESNTQDITPRISRSGSQATLDSLDLTRYSEDGGGADEKVAVLEFELRKAKETINALRNNLTVATESECSTPDKGSLRTINLGSIKPHEQRALNFLINEYLLLHEYKLTSITFADENQNQDFDDWDDVGLNISKPPELLTLYREGLKQTGQNSVSTSVQTENVHNEQYEKHIERLKKEMGELKQKVQELEAENLNLVNASNNFHHESEMFSSQKIEQSDEIIPLTNRNVASSKNSFGSESPERFEIIDKDMTVFKKSDSIVEDNISNNSFNTSDWTKLTLNMEGCIPLSTRENDLKGENYPRICDLISSNPFRKEVFSLCYLMNIPKLENDILENVIDKGVNSENIVHILSHSLLRVIPNIILNKREEAIPLLIGAVLLNRNSSERDKLLQQLFTLKKKPSDYERSIILTGIIGIAKHSDELLAENEILPQCWEQLAHKYVERRLLVVEACIALLPYVSSQIRNSLILSMLQQMIEDKEEVVRESVVKALTLLMSLCDDLDKYDQCEELALSTLNDSSVTVVNLSTQLLFPVLGKWAFELGRISSSLLKHLLQKLNAYLKDTESPTKLSQLPDKILRVINILDHLLTFLLMSIATHENIMSNVEKEMERPLRPDLLRFCNNLTNPKNFYQSDKNVGVILYEFSRFISSNQDKSWKEMDWMLDIMIPDLLNNLNHIETTQHILLQGFINLFSHICIVFGREFTKYKIAPLLCTQTQNLEQILQSFNQYSPCLNIIPVYLVSVLSYCDHEELATVLKKFICVLPLCGTPLDCLEVTVKGICEHGLQEIVVSSLWEGVVHQRPLVKAASATLFSDIVGICDDSLLISKVTPALVTLASENDVLVRTATIPALGSLITDCNVKEIHDKVYMQLQTYIADTSLKENHTLQRQLVVTLGNIVNSCTPAFRQEVILPELSSLSSCMLQMQNPTRKVDMALALIEAFTNVVYSPLSKQNCSQIILSGLRCLEIAVGENQSLLSHHETVLSMLKECDIKYDMPMTQLPLDRSNKLTHNVNQGVEEMRQKVSKIFTKPVGSKPNTLPNLQAIFKKK